MAPDRAHPSSARRRPLDDVDGAQQVQGLDTISFPLWKYNPVTARLMKGWLAPGCRDLRHVLFVASTGRSGTATLAAILQRVEGCAAYHEPWPAMHGGIMQQRNAGHPDLARRVYRWVKSVNIRRLAQGATCYAETNHMFIKSFVDHAAEEFGAAMRVIHLVRDPVLVASSMYALGRAPRSIQWNSFWLDYRAPMNLVPLADALDRRAFRHPFFKCLWYWYEMEARIADWKKRLEGRVAFAPLRTGDLKKPDAVAGTLHALGIDAGRGFDFPTDLRLNQKPKKKRRRPPSEAEAAHMDRVFRRLLRDTGHGHVADVGEASAAFATGHRATPAGEREMRSERAAFGV
jgi:hypothetical protein